VAAEPEQSVAAVFLDGPMAGTTQTLLPKFAVAGAESWYPEKRPDGARDRSADLKRATGHRYILHLKDDGTPEFFHQPPIKLINREDVTIGLGVMQAVYTIAIILGFRSALEAAYPAIVHPLHHGQAALGHPILLLALLTLMLLGLRFFWVTRNLYALVIDHPREKAKERLGTVVRFHFPITFLHAVLFFVLCDIYRSMAKALFLGSIEPLVKRFVLFTIILLALNGLWLLMTFLPLHLRKQESKRAETKPAILWAVLNIVFAALAAIWVYLFSPAITSSMTAVLAVASVLFLLNSLLDLASTASSYVEFPGSPLAR
jgi:hypothetical protein